MFAIATGIVCSIYFAANILLSPSRYYLPKPSSCSGNRRQSTSSYHGPPASSTASIRSGTTAARNSLQRLPSHLSDELKDMESLQHEDLRSQHDGESDARYGAPLAHAARKAAPPPGVPRSQQGSFHGSYSPPATPTRQPGEHHPRQPEPTRAQKSVQPDNFYDAHGEASSNRSSPSGPRPPPQMKARLARKEAPRSFSRSPRASRHSPPSPARSAGTVSTLSDAPPSPTERLGGISPQEIDARNRNATEMVEKATCADALRRGDGEEMEREVSSEKVPGGYPYE